MSVTTMSFMILFMVINMEKRDGYVFGFWIEGFGEIEMSYYPDCELEEINLKPEKCYYINKKALEQIDKICKMIEAHAEEE